MIEAAEEERVPDHREICGSMAYRQQHRVTTMVNGDNQSG